MIPPARPIPGVPGCRTARSGSPVPRSATLVRARLNTSKCNTLAGWVSYADTPALVWRSYTGYVFACVVTVTGCGTLSLRLGCLRWSS